MKKDKKIPVSVRLAEPTTAQLRAYAQRFNVSFSEIVEATIQSGLVIAESLFKTADDEKGDDLNDGEL